MAEKIKMSAIRAQFPMYADLSDEQLLIGLRQKFYPDIKPGDFYGRVDFDTERERLQKQNVDEMSGFDKFRAGMGKAFTDVARGAGQLVGMVDRSDIDEAQGRDAALMDSGAGIAGNIAGNVAAFAPAALIPGVNTVAGAGLVGAGMGAVQPVGEDDSRLQNMALGGILGSGTVLAGRALHAGVQGAKALVEPFTQSGRQRIAGRTLERFAANPQAVRAAAGGPTATGAVPTLAEASQDTGIAALQRALESSDPQIAAQMAERQMANNAARVQALRSVAGDAVVPASRVGRLNQIVNSQPTREAAESARSAAARRGYGAAMDAGVDQKMAAAMAPQIESLMARPSVRAGVARARQLAAEEGIELADPGSVQGLHYLKQSLDDMVGRLRDQPARQRLVQQTSQDLSSVLDEIAPLYQQARREFQLNSVPVNRADVGRRLADTALSATRDMSGNRRLQANAFAKALNDEETLIRQATGFRGGPSALDDFMSPTQMGRINAVRNELELAANLAQAANGPGSQTAKTLASQNLLRQILGPTGAPESWAESTLLTNLARPVQFAYGTAEPAIQNALADILLNPGLARAAMASAQQTPRQLPATVNRLLPYMEQAAKSSVPAAGLVAGQR